MIRVLIADDDPVVRRGVRDVLEAEPDIRVAGEAATAADVLELARREPWDLVVLDLNLPDRHGLEVLRDLRAIRAGMPVLILTMHPERQFAVRALQSGAAGYVTKDAVDAELVRAVRIVVRGGRFVTEALAELLAERLTRDSDAGAPHEQLSEREHAVLLRIGAGKSVTQIAAELRLSPKTVSTYRARVLEKLRLTTTAEIIHYVARNRLGGG
jgi:DNA-binding NarL/FixJ family response regulator